MTRSRSFLSSKKKFNDIIFNHVKGFIGSRNNLYKVASKAFIKSLCYSKRDRRKKSSLNKRKYINVINLGLKIIGKNYSKFKKILLVSNIIINNKMFYKIVLLENKMIFFSIIKNLFY